MTGIIITAAVIVVIVVTVAGLYAIENPDTIYALFVDRPDIKFFETPTLSESNIPENFSSILSITVRNFDDVDVSNIEARLVVTDGGNWKEHLQFQEIIPLSDSLSPGETSEKINIPIKATKLSGTETPFTLTLELYGDDKLTATKTFHIKII